MTAAAPSPLDAFGPATRAWFEAAFAAPTRVQRDGWPVIARGEDALLIAPTGSGKTLAAFLWCLDAIARRPPDAEPGYRVVYVSPLKALVYDVERNLRTPLTGIAQTALHLGVDHRPVRVDVRTGDTPPDARRRMARDPGDILVTTPESLYLLLGSDARRNLVTVETLIIDEIHALAPTKRGAHLALSVARLAHDAHARPQRIGLSATVRPAAEIARFLSGDGPATVIDAAEPPHIDIEIIVPLEDMARPSLDAPSRPSRPSREDASGDLLGTLSPQERASVWPAIEPRIVAMCAMQQWSLADLSRLVRSTYTFSGLSDDALHGAILDHLAARGASFLVELGLRTGSPSQSVLMAALWDLVWAGRVTNDTFGPLRALSSPFKPAARRGGGAGRAHAAALSGATGGRWSLAADLAPVRPSDTERAHAMASVLLERWGVLGREALAAEEVPGGFSGLYPVLREMEEVGRIRRGYFVEGLSGAQFAVAGAVDRLRDCRDVAGAPEVTVLAATDPANPWGAVLPWPTVAVEGGQRPGRAAGATVVLVDGDVALFVAPRGRQLVTFSALCEDGVAAVAFGALRGLAGSVKSRILTVEQIDGAPARGGPWEAALVRAGFAPDYRGMMLTA